MWFPGRDARKGAGDRGFLPPFLSERLTGRGKFVFGTAERRQSSGTYSYGAAPALLLVSPVEVARKCPEVGTVLAPPRARQKGAGGRVGDNRQELIIATPPNRSGSTGALMSPSCTFVLGQTTSSTSWALTPVRRRPRSEVSMINRVLKANQHELWPTASPDVFVQEPRKCL